MKELNTISNEPLSPETLDFEALLREGIAQSQLLSSAQWTDYNEHDPGVTILEYLCFALTDLGYRTAHPIEDILSSSAASCETRLDQQPLFTGNHILCTAPLTEEDYRKKIYETDPWIKNAWLKKVEGQDQAVRGLYKVFIQTFAPVPPKRDPQWATGPDEPPEPDEDSIVQRVRESLMRLRMLGEDFASVAVIPKNEYALDAEIEIAAGTDPESTIARLLFRVEMQLNPPPKVRDVDQQFQDNVPADQIFNGPELSLGTIDSDSLKPLKKEIQTEMVLEAILNVPGIREVSHLRIISLSPGDRAEAQPDDPDSAVTIPTFSRTAESVQRIHVFLDGTLQSVRPDRVLDHLRHYEEKRRWEYSYAMRRMKDIAYAQIPTGNAERGLSRYRSIQHYFPEAYGIGRHGVGDDILEYPEAPSAKETRQRRYAEARQLKGYLLFFEQLLADYLAQLDHTSSLFSFEHLDQTYFSQPVTHPAGPDAEDGPPGIAAVLGDVGPQNPNWYKRYKDGLTALTANQDPKNDRRERALDHLLARFNERFDNERLCRLDGGETETRDAFLQWRVDRKREFLEDYVNLSVNRALGLNLLDPWEQSTGCLRETALQKRIRLKSGLQAPPVIVEHILLRDLDRPPGIGELEINEDFRIEQAAPITGILFSFGHWTLHGVIRSERACTSWLTLRQRILRLAADPSMYVPYPSGAYQVAVRLDGGGPISIDVVEQFPSTVEARAITDHLARLCGGEPPEAPNAWELVRPTALPIDFFDHAVSVILPSPVATSIGGAARTPVVEGFVESVVAEALPAHVAQNCYWLEHDEMAAFEADYTAWVSAQHAVRKAQSTSGTLCRTAAAASRKLRDRLNALYCRDFLADRDHLRATGVRQ